MKLKGKNIKRIKPNKKQIMEVTLAKMKKRRVKDSANLRDKLNIKLKWAKDEKQLGLDIIASYKKAIEKVTKQIFNLDGCIMGLEDILETEKKK